MAAIIVGPTLRSRCRLKEWHWRNNSVVFYDVFHRLRISSTTIAIVKNAPLVTKPYIGLHSFLTACYNASHRPIKSKYKSRKMTEEKNNAAYA